MNKIKEVAHRKISKSKRDEISEVNVVDLWGTELSGVTIYCSFLYPPSAPIAGMGSTGNLNFPVLPYPSKMKILY